MGCSGSKPTTVLECMVKNFKKGFSGDYGIKLSSGKLRTLCTLEWPSLGVGWPPDGTLDVAVVQAVYKVVTRDPGHADQFPYIDQWLEIAQLRPPWVRFCITGQEQCRVLVAQSRKIPTHPEKEPPISLGETEEPPPVSPPFVLTVSPLAAGGPHLPGSPPTPVSPPPEPPEAPVPPQSSSPEPTSRQLQAVQEASAPVLQLLSPAGRGPEHIAAEGTLQGGGSVCHYQPFSSADLLNWTLQIPPYSEKPQALIDLLEPILQTSLLTWGDCQQLLIALFNPEELARITTEAQKWLQTVAPEGQLDVENWARGAFPEREPFWDPDTEVGRSQLGRYRQALLQGVKAGAKKPPNLAKITGVLQGAGESPAHFYERLCEAFPPDFDLDSPENQRFMNTVFVGQAQSDIRKQLEKLEGFAGKNTLELLELANKVFANRDQVAHRDAEKRIKQEAELLAAAVLKAARPVGPPHKPRGPIPGRRVPLRHDQCAYCKERGHWKNECPIRPKKRVTAAGPPGRCGPKPPSTHPTSPARAGRHQGEPGSLQFGPREPVVRIRTGGQPVDFMVDNDTGHSVATQQAAPFSGKEITTRAAGSRTPRPLCDPRQGQLGGLEGKPGFPYRPDCSVPLAEAQVSFSADGSSQLQSAGPPSPLARSPAEESIIPTELEAEYPLVWAEGNPPGLAKNHAPFKIDLKPGAWPVKVPEDSIPREARLGIQTHLDRLRQHGILVKCQSPWSTPLRPEKKPGTQEYRLVQNLRAVNKVTVKLPSAVPNPFNLLGQIPSAAAWFTCLDLKDASFCFRVTPVSQPLFAFLWENPHTGAKEQLTWTRLPQGFKNTQTLLSRALADDLAGFPAQELECVLLQYVDDLLLASSTQAQCLEGTKALLSLLTEAGYRVSKKKAQICQTQVRFLGFTVTQGQLMLGAERKRELCAIPTPSTRLEVQKFLGKIEFCRRWIPGFAALVRPLQESVKGQEKAALEWGRSQKVAFQTIKDKISEAPALGLPDINKDFNLFVHEKKGMALGVLTQEFGPRQRPVAYLCKDIDSVAAQWPPCLRVVDATALLVKEADKLTLGRDLNVKVPHTVITLIDSAELPPARKTRYQRLLCENPRIKLEVVGALNPVTFLPDEAGPPAHDCLEILGVIRPTSHLETQPWFLYGNELVSEMLPTLGWWM